MHATGLQWRAFVCVRAVAAIAEDRGRATESERRGTGAMTLDLRHVCVVRNSVIRGSARNDRRKPANGSGGFCRLPLCNRPAA